MVTTRQTMFAIGPHKHCLSRDVRVQSSKWCGPGSVRHEVLRSSTKQLLNCEKGPGRLPAGPPLGSTGLAFCNMTPIAVVRSTSMVPRVLTLGVIPYEFNPF